MRPVESRPYKLSVRHPLDGGRWAPTRSFASAGARDKKADFYRRQGWEVLTFGSTARDRQVADLADEETVRERQVRELDDLEIIAANDLDGALKLGWDRYLAWRQQMEKLMVRKIAEIVRGHVPGATAIRLDASDQGGDGWTFGGGARAPNLSSTYSNGFPELHDDDDLSILLSDLGLFLPNSDNGTREGVFWLDLDPKEDDGDV